MKPTAFPSDCPASARRRCFEPFVSGSILLAKSFVVSSFAASRIFTFIAIPIHIDFFILSING